MWPSFYEAKHLDVALVESFFLFFPLGIIRKAINATLLQYNSVKTSRRYYTYFFFGI